MHSISEITVALKKKMIVIMCLYSKYTCVYGGWGQLARFNIKNSLLKVLVLIIVVSMRLIDKKIKIAA